MKIIRILIIALSIINILLAFKILKLWQIGSVSTFIVATNIIWAVLQSIIALYFAHKIKPISIFVTAAYHRISQGVCVLSALLFSLQTWEYIRFVLDHRERAAQQPEGTQYLPARIDFLGSMDQNLWSVLLILLAFTVQYLLGQERKKIDTSVFND